MTGPISIEHTLRLFPELQELITVREAGWHFRPIADKHAQLAWIVGSFSRAQYTDALWIADGATAQAIHDASTASEAGDTATNRTAPSTVLLNMIETGITERTRNTTVRDDVADRGVNENYMVGDTGIEPVTSSV